MKLSERLYFNQMYFSVSLGYTDRLVANPWSLNRKVVKIIAHKNWSPITDINDIALLKLDVKDFRFKSFKSKFFFLLNIFHFKN